jgi:MoaA/NifB/PqqE/SkfB family radical SAM enzyme
MKYVITENERVKICTSKDYNYVFDKKTGDFARWGATKEEDPSIAYCPEILDIEIATACDGIGSPDGKASPCKFCYKANKRAGEQMSIETFQKLFDKLPKTCTQIAFGIGNLYGHDDMWKIFAHTRENGVIPNVTINGWELTDEVADKLSLLMGAVSISRYNPKDVCYDAVKKLTDRGMTQINIHQLVSEQSYDGCMELLKDMETDPRLSKLNAVVFLMLKPKGRGSVMGQMKDFDKYKEMVDYALERNLRIGFDSCSVPSFLNVTKDHANFKSFEQSTDRCESGLFSLYIDVKARVWPCSFGQDRHDLEPINVLEIEDFERDVWNSPQMDRWRKRLNNNERSCPLYDLDIKEDK